MIKRWNAFVLITLMLWSADVALAAGGSKATLADWHDRLPVLAAIVIAVLLVDLIFCVVAVINSQRRQSERQMALERD